MGVPLVTHSEGSTYHIEKMNWELHSTLRKGQKNNPYFILLWACRNICLQKDLLSGKMLSLSLCVVRFKKSAFFINNLLQILMNVQSNLPGVGTMQSATITQEPTAVSAWRATTFQMAEYAWVSSVRNFPGVTTSEGKAWLRVLTLVGKQTPVSAARGRLQGGLEEALPSTCLDGRSCQEQTCSWNACTSAC